MSWFGNGFGATKSGWRYPAEPMQHFWRASLFAALLFLLFLVLQGVFGVIADMLVFHANAASFNALKNLGTGDPGSDVAFANFMKATLVGMVPVGLIIAGLCVFTSRFGLPGMQGRLPLAWPPLGLGGWVLLFVAFGAFMVIYSLVLFNGLGIDPESYQTSSAGLADAKSKAGLVEKTLAELANNPRLFAMAIPGVVIGAPLAEEFLFRGALFAGIAQSPLGRIGAVIITAALWALAHAQAAPWVFVGLLFGMGLFMGVVLLRTGSLWVTVILHGVWNSLSAFAMFHGGSS